MKCPDCNHPLKVSIVAAVDNFESSYFVFDCESECATIAGNISIPKYRLNVNLVGMNLTEKLSYMESLMKMMKLQQGNEAIDVTYKR